MYFSSLSREKDQYCTVLSVSQSVCQSVSLSVCQSVSQCSSVQVTAVHGSSAAKNACLPCPNLPDVPYVPTQVTYTHLLARQIINDRLCRHRRTPGSVLTPTPLYS